MKNKVGPVDGTDFIGGNYTATFISKPIFYIVPEDTNTDINVFLDFGNIWGVDYEVLLMIVIKLDHQLE